jgi:hypothetical protein
MCRSNWIVLLVVLLSVSLIFSFSVINPAEAGLVAHWPLDGDTDDATGNGNDGILNGEAQWVEGISGEALEFDGATGWVDAGNAPGLAPSPMSCMFWLRPSKELGLDDPRANIVYYGVGPMFAFNKTPVADEPLGPPNSIRVWIDTLGDIPKGTLFTKRDIWNEGEWYHLACTYDEKELVLYEDGKETGRVKATGAIGARTSEFRIAKPFAGSIDEVKLYDRALSDKEILALGGLAVEPHGKFTTAWGLIKTGQN